MKHVKHLMSALLITLILASCFMGGVAVADEADDVDNRPGTTSGYSLTVVDAVTVEETETPLAGTPTMTETCCILHLFLMIGAFLVAVYYTCDQRMSQVREFELRRELSK